MKRPSEECHPKEGTRKEKMAVLSTNYRFFISKIPKQNVTNKESPFAATMYAMVCIPFI